MKIGISIILGLLFFISIPQIILAYPDFLFHKKHSYKNFSLLSDEKFQNDINTDLDEIISTLEISGFYNSNKKIKIILCNSARLSAFLDMISLVPSGVGFHHFSNSIFIFPLRIENNRNENSKAIGEHFKLIQYTYQEFKLSQIICHEVLHKLHSDTLGIWEFKSKMPPPHWKAEGFAEYYTYLPNKKLDNTYEFRKRVALYLKYKDQFPLFYYKSQLLYEFLTEQKKLSFNEIMNENVTEKATLNQLIKWYKN